VRALLSDDHNYELGIQKMRQAIENVVAFEGAAGLGEAACALALKLATALERIAADQGM
jgi:hypothetical protein